MVIFGQVLNKFVPCRHASHSMTFRWKHAGRGTKMFQWEGYSTFALSSWGRVMIRGGVEDTRLEAKAKDKDTKKSEAKAKDSLSKDKTSRGQRQECSRPRPRTKDTGASVFQKKKGFQNFFSGDLQFIGVLRIFDWGRPKPQITWYDVIKIFSKKTFLWDKDIVGWKIWNQCCLFARNQDFAK